MSVRSSRPNAIATSQQMANASKPGKCALGCRNCWEKEHWML